MKNKKNKTNSKYDIEYMQAIIEGLNERNEELESEVERLKNEIAETNEVNIQLDSDEQSYKNLVQLHTLLMVLMNLVTPHCDNSPLGQSVGLAIKKYLMTIGKNLAKGTLFVMEKDKADWEDEDDEEFDDKEWDEDED